MTMPLILEPCCFLKKYPELMEEKAWPYYSYNDSNI